MFPKLTLVIVLTAGIGAALLGLRQQRLALMHEMAKLHQQMLQDRQATWDLQVRNNTELAPRQLKMAIEQAGLDLVPITPVQVEPPYQLAEGAYAPQP